MLHDMNWISVRPSQSFCASFVLLLVHSLLGLDQSHLECASAFQNKRPANTIASVSLPTTTETNDVLLSHSKVPRINLMKSE